jgi:SAM-dependent methyltransferase
MTGDIDRGLRTANEESGAEFWDALYASREPDSSRDPNPQLAAEAGDLAPGFALDVGCADGCDAGWLAERGWRVTAVDVSNVALDRARAATPKLAERIEWLQADLREWTPAASTYDLVSAHFVHFLPDERAVVFRRLAAAVRPRGTLLIVGHHPSDLGNNRQTLAGPRRLCNGRRDRGAARARPVGRSRRRSAPTQRDRSARQSRHRTRRDHEGAPPIAAAHSFGLRRRLDSGVDRH